MMGRIGWLYTLLLVLAAAGCTDAPRAASGEPPPPLRIDAAPDESITLAALSPDGRTLAYGLCPIPPTGPGVKPDTGVVVLCDARTGKELHRLTGPEHTWPLCASFSPDGKRLAVDNGSKYSVSLWDSAEGVWRADLDGMLGGSQPPPWLPDGSLLAGGIIRADFNRKDGDIHLWSATDGKEVRAYGPVAPPGADYAGFAYSANGRAVAVQYWTQERAHPGALEKIIVFRWRRGVDLWDAGAGRRLGVVTGFSPPVEGRNPPPSRLPEVGAEWGAFRPRPLPGGRYLLLPTYDGYPFLKLETAGGTVVLTNALTGRDVRRFEDFKDGGIRTAALSADGSTVAVAAQVTIGRSDTAAVVWDVSELAEAVRKEAAGLSAEELAPLWDALADPNAQKAFPAMRLLALNPERAVSLLKDRLRPVDDHRVPQWIADLNSDDFEAREAASRDLAALGEAARPSLEKAAAAGPPAEARRRLNDLRDKLKGDLGGEDLRGVRAVDVLEQIGTAPARDVLKGLAAGAPAALMTQAAKAALDRLEQTPKP